VGPSLKRARRGGARFGALWRRPWLRLGLLSRLPPRQPPTPAATATGVHDCGGHPSPAAALPFRRQARGSWEPRLRDACGPWRRPSITPDLEEAGGDAIFPALFPSPAAGLFTAKGDGKRMAWGFQLPSAGGVYICLLIACFYRGSRLAMLSAVGRSQFFLNMHLNKFHPIEVVGLQYQACVSQN
jgi:hypothetical protein